MLVHSYDIVAVIFETTRLYVSIGTDIHVDKHMKSTFISALKLRDDFTRSPQ